MTDNRRPPSDYDRGQSTNWRAADRDLRRAWWRADKGDVSKHVFDAVITIESEQWATFDRFVKLEVLYDPNSHLGTRAAESMGLVTENIVAKNVDAAAAATSSQKTRTVFDTDGADWHMQRKLKKLGWYVECAATDMDRQLKCWRAHKSGIKKGTGTLHGYIDQWDRPVLDYVIVDDIVVNDRECRNNASPRQIHRRTIVDREELQAEYPQYAKEIEQARSRQLWADYRPLEPHEIVKLESYRLPIGVKGQKGYAVGRHTICIEGCDLLDEDFEDDELPVPKITWEYREGSWYGISLSERIAGHQRQTNKMNWGIDRNIDLMAVPVTYVRPVDVAAGLTAKPTKAGMFVQIKGDFPKTEVPQANSTEVYNRIEKLDASAAKIAGLNDLALHGAVPSGLESGVAIREAKGATSDRFAPQEEAFEKLNIQADLLILRLCKKLGKKAPTYYKKTRFSSKKIEWADVDMGELKVTASAAGTLSRTHAGRIQFVMDLAQTGVISTPTMLKLLDHPDLESELSLYTAAMDVIDEDLEDIADGEVVMPEPQGNLKLVEVRAQETYEKWSHQGAPEDVLEGVRQYINQAIAYQQNAAQAANQNMPMSAPAANDNGMPGAMQPDQPGAMPMGGTAPGGDAGVGALAAPGVVPPQLRAV